MMYVAAVFHRHRELLLHLMTSQKDEWIAGKTIAVQVGDVLDRGWQELQVG